MAEIYNENSNTILTGTSNDDTIQNGGYMRSGNGYINLSGGSNVTIIGRDGNDSILNWSDTYNVSINSGLGNDEIENYGLKVKIICGDDADAVYNYGLETTISGDFGNDFIHNLEGENSSINGGSGEDTISNWATGVTISGGAGNDSICNTEYGNNTSISGGLGNDSIDNWNASNVLFQYAAGDGNDLIQGFNETSTLLISGGSYSTAQSGSDIIVTVGDGKISLIGAASLAKVNIKGTKTSFNVWKLNGTTVTYGTESKTLIKVTGVKSLDGISLSGKVVTVAASSLNKKKVSITGNGYKLELADDVTTPKTKKAAWAYKSGTATFKSSYKTAGYKLASNGKSISYSKATTAEGLATIDGAKSKSFTVSGDKITLKNAALKNKVTVSGGYEFNFTSDYKKATISGSSKGDTITTNGNNLSVNGGAGDDTLKIFGSKTTVKGGDGADVFIFKAGSNVIADYAEEDLISLAGAAQVTTSGDDVIFTADSNKITVTGGADKTISYVDASGKQTYSASSSDVSINGKTIKLLEDYMDDSFNVADYGEKLQTIDAAAVQLDIEIIGNKLRNSIKGGENNETLIGGKGNDTLTGGEGSDVFIYAKGDGNDIITDYAEEDKIKITSGTAKVKKNGSNVIFTVGSGKITVKGAANKTVTYIEGGKTKYFPKKPASPIILTDKNTTAILRETYSDSTYTATSAIKKIDASAVQRNLSITGNGKANVILGGSEDDTLYGGKGNDTLQGGSGADVFTYANGDGKDIIIDYAEEDTIQITSGKVSKTTKGDDVIFTIGSGKITVLGAADKNINVTNSSGVKESWFVANDDNFATDNDLSALVQSKAADYSLAEVETSLKSANALPSVTYSDKK